ncbi:NAD(P)-dependent oxidoreductase [Kribbella catacumbae]|uniref:NAD(P)-dependent oxidoreductase n=1 Tax=Kribbella catacumbae TaxID=460086 RepID=UPI00037BF53D|nr:NAD(P)H-binding protein [Kribbella catacumbae]
MRITVFGATGRIGAAAVEQALEAGHKVVAVVRATAQYEVTHPALEVVKVSGLTAAAELLGAVDGAEAVLSGVGPRGRKDGPVTSTATRAITQAMWETGVRRYVGVSAAPVGPVPPDDSLVNRRLIHPFFSWFLKETYADLALMERELANTGIEWTVVRPPKLVSKPVTGTYRTALDANLPRGLSISREDTAHLMLSTLTDPSTIGHPVGIAY